MRITFLRSSTTFGLSSSFQPHNHPSVDSSSISSMKRAWSGDGRKVHFLFLSSSLTVFDDLAERPPNGDGGVTTCLIGNSRFMSCPSFVTIETVFSGSCLTKQANGFVKVGD